MLLILILHSITCVCFIMLAFIAISNPAGINVVANRWLGVFFTSAAGMLLNAVIYGLHADGHYPELIALGESIRFAMAPALYLAVLQFTVPGSTFNRRDILHFVPFMLFLVGMAPGIFITGFSYPLMPVGLSNTLAIALTIIINAQLIIYWLLAYYRLKQHQLNIELVASDTTPVNLSWLNHLLLTIGCMLFVFAVSNVLQLHVSLFYPVIYCAGSFAICYFLIRQKEIFPYQPAEILDVRRMMDELQETPRGVKMRVPDEESARLKTCLDKLMATDKIYLDCELNLPQMAQLMSVSVHDLSFLLNDVIGLNFFQYINSYRVEEAKALLLSSKHKHLNILGIAYNAGFSSKITFNTAFKKQTGLSPSRYIKVAQSAPASYR